MRQKTALMLLIIRPFQRGVFRRKIKQKIVLFNEKKYIYAVKLYVYTEILFIICCIGKNKNVILPLFHKI